MPSWSCATPAAIWLRPPCAPLAYPFQKSSCWYAAVAFWPASETPAAEFGSTTPARNSADGVPAPVAVNETSWAAAPTGPNRIIVHDRRRVPPGDVVTVAPDALTLVNDFGTSTLSWATSGSCTVIVVCCGRPAVSS